jgi:hypothetical protein
LSSIISGGVATDSGKLDALDAPDIGILIGTDNDEDIGLGVVEAGVKVDDDVDDIAPPVATRKRRTLTTKEQ